MRENIIIALRSAFSRWRMVATVKTNSGPFAVNPYCFAASALINIDSCVKRGCGCVRCYDIAWEVQLRLCQVQWCCVCQVQGSYESREAVAEAPRWPWHVADVGVWSAGSHTRVSVEHRQPHQRRTVGLHRRRQGQRMAQVDTPRHWYYWQSASGTAV